MGCDSARHARYGETFSFNPRTHMGCDAAKKAAKARAKVSIHAPTWGATVIRSADNILSLLFQSTHPHGVRLCVISPHYCRVLFQSTHPHGVRRFTLLTTGQSIAFQSTHPHGVRHEPTRRVINLTKFQSTHPHGVRQSTSTDCQAITEFQSTHPHGVRQFIRVLDRRWYRFNPRTHMGCD